MVSEIIFQFANDCFIMKLNQYLTAMINEIQISPTMSLFLVQKPLL